MKNGPKRPTDQETDALYEAILSLKSLEEARRFFRDILTETEIAAMAERWKVAKLLFSGSSYSSIIGMTGVSSTTVARVAQWLKKGTGGYKLALSRTEAVGATPDETPVEKKEPHAYSN